MRINYPALSLCSLLLACQSRPAQRPAVPQPPPKTGPTTTTTARTEHRGSAPPTVPSLPGAAHPDYPTAEAAGTEKLFVVEEPDRGPWVTSVKLPESGSLRSVTHLHCEVSEAGIACGPAVVVSVSGTVRWQVGSRDGRPVLAQRLARERVQESYVFDRQGDRLVQLARLDAHGVVSWVRHFDPGMRQYSARNLNGANALPGCGRIAFKLDAKGRTLEQSCRQWGGEGMRDLEGVRLRRYRHDPYGFVIEEARLTPEGSPMADNDGAHRIQFKRDPAGRPTEIRYLDIEGKPVLSTRNGCHGELLRYGHGGPLVERTCLGPQGTPAPGRNHASRETYEVDDHGCVQKVLYLDGEGRAVVTSNGITEERFSVNAACDQLTRTCYLTGKPSPCGPKEPSRYLKKLDEHGWLSSVQHFNVPATGQGRPAGDPIFTVFEVRYRRDRVGNAVATSCFDAASMPVDCGTSGFHRAEDRIDHAGRVVERRFFSRGGAAASNLGCELRRFQYDNYDHLVRESEHDRQGRGRETAGMAARRTLFDQSHRRFAVLLLDSQARPARYHACFLGAHCPLSGSAGSWHAVRIVRGSKGELKENLFFDWQGALLQRVSCTVVQCWD